MIIGSKVYKIEETKNSMELVKEYVDTATDGSLFLVKKLLMAHGRDGREWKIYDGQLSCTLLLKPTNLKQISKQDIPTRLTQLNMAISLGILSSLWKYGVRLKWPNDLIIDGKKVGGIIIEIIWSGTDISGIIVGFSVNVNNVFNSDDELYGQATSLKHVLNKNFDIDELLGKQLKLIDEFYKKWLNGKFDEIFQLWREGQIYKNKRIKVHQKNDAVISGVFHDVLENGELILLYNGCFIKIPFYLIDKINAK